LVEHLEVSQRCRVPPCGCEDCRAGRRKSAVASPKDTLAARHATSRCLRWFRWVQQPENVSLWPYREVFEIGADFRL